MNPDRLTAQRRAQWERLDVLVERLYRRGPRSLAGEEVSELVYLYRETSADLARLRCLEADASLIHHVNRLVTRAHGQLYRRREGPRISLLSFLFSDFPRLFRRRWRYTAVSLLIFVAFGAMGYVSVREDPAVVGDILGGAEQEFRGEKTGEEIRARFEEVPSPVLSALVTSNNILVALTAFALGITFGIGTVYVLTVNGTMLGGFAGTYAQSGVAGDFWMTVMVHGGVELTAIIIAGGAGLIMGHALWCPGRRTRLRALREEARDAVQLALGLIPAFVVAGILEGFVTPTPAIPAHTKILLGSAVMLLYWAYLGMAGRQRRITASPSTPRAARR